MEKMQPYAKENHHYVFVEKIGPFQSTAPQAWKNLHQLVPENNKITGYMSL
jgi:hypothetical protein